jgi:A/G-specific adenine glycosylase
LRRSDEDAQLRAKLSAVRHALFHWAKRSSRRFFWRNLGVSPFTLLITEILLSRTRAVAVEPIALKLSSRYPAPADLASASLGEIERILYPLGLYRKRSRQLIACAQALQKGFNGEVPQQLEQLMALPYVGRYSANAVMCFAYGKRKAVIDANVSRVLQRVFSLPAPPPRLSSANTLWDFAEKLLPQRDAKEFNWALLDLGGMVCTPRKPVCSGCPLKALCDAHRQGTCGCQL